MQDQKFPSPDLIVLRGGEELVDPSHVDYLRGRERRREGGKEGGREAGREGRREEGRKGGRAYNYRT